MSRDAMVPLGATGLPAGRAGETNDVLADAAHRLSGVGKGAASIAGSVDDLGALTDKAAGVFGDMQQSLGRMIDANRHIAARAKEGVDKADRTHQSVGAALARAGNLADAVARVQGGISEVSGALRQVADASEIINKIAFQTRIVAFNASVEAVRAGDAGRGFGVVAQAVKDLAQQVGDSSRQIALVIDELTERVRDLERQIQSEEGDSGAVADGGDARHVVQEAIRTFEQEFGEVEGMMRDIAAQSAQSQAECDHSVGTLRTFGNEFSRSVELVKTLRAESAALLEISEDAIEHFASYGVETEDSPFISAAMSTAQAIGQRFEAAVAAGEITLEALFDSRYRPVPGSNPAQFLTDFVAFTDAVLPEFQEPVLGFSPLVTFCAAVDRNAYLPTHNLKFSQPQGSDPVKNAANSRNRRIFNDRTGKRAADNKAPFLLQTYRREMSAGQFVLMKDVSAPIWVSGRHWGGLRIGYRFE